MNILGINAYHGDSSAALVVDGQLVAAVEEERFNRIKHCGGVAVGSGKAWLPSGQARTVAGRSNMGQDKVCNRVPISHLISGESSD